MGFGTIVAALVSITMILMAAYIFTTGGLYMIDVLTNSIKMMQNNKNEQLKTEIEISNIIANGTNINVTVNNTGHTKIREFSKMDVIIHYYTLPTGTMKIVWISYTDETPNDNEWTVTEISPDKINPGIFDPGERMTIWIKLSSEYPVDPESVNNWLQITAPNGVSTSGYFNG
ncbi:MAG: hypothetical protein ACXQT5_03510 [Candidatus Syntropharchaeia archaeon]